MNWKEITSRVTGFSVPGAGIQWNPPEAEVAVARRVLSLLEDRRVLYAPHALEIPEHCIISANQIRQALTAEIGKLGKQSQLSTSLQGIRRAARDFVSEVGDIGESRDNTLMQRPWSAALFGMALGKFRSTSGTYIAILASTYHLDVDGELEMVLPAKLLDRDV